jgi:hypothetical protein
MKNRKILILISLLAMSAYIMIMPGCKKDSDSTEKAEFAVLDVSAETGWNFMAVAQNGSNMMVKASAGVVKEVFFKPTATQLGYSIMMNQSGRPEKIVINNNIVLLNNFVTSKVDAAVVLPDGTIKVLREVESGFDITMLNSITITGDDDWQNMIKFAGLATSMTSGALAQVSAAGSGVMIPAEAIGVSSQVLLKASSVGISGDKTKLSMLNASAIESLTSVAGCSAVDMNCILSSTTEASSITQASLTLIASKEEIVNTAEGVLIGGYGDIQVNLTWSTEGDVDLWVTDPNGEKTYWNNPNSASGGYLDVDNTSGFGPENVFWEAGKAINGTYKVEVDYFSGSVETTYGILIIVDGVVLNGGQPYTGQLNPEETVVVTEFTYGTKSTPVFINQKRKHDGPKPVK